MKDHISRFEQLIQGKYSRSQSQEILRALEWAKELHEGQKRASGEPYLIHPMKVAEFLSDLEMDYQTIIGGLLHDIIEDTHTSFEEIEARFGADVLRLVDGVTKISSVKTENRIVQSSETIRKTLFAMSEDIRVVIIKLADKYHNMLTLEFLPPDKQKRISQECLDIYAPLAERLGMSWLKAELEDLSLRYLYPTAWKHIIEGLEVHQEKRTEYLETIKQIILKQGKKEGLHFEVQTRAKHIYSIYMKMKQQKKPLDEMFDLLGIRLICQNVIQCYTLLGMVHSLWPPIEGRFKDYIAMPKANRYQSLHTTIMCDNGQLLEVQIRTKEMHSLAEFGVAAHWAYKKVMRNEKTKPNELNIINKLRDWNKNGENSVDFIQKIKKDLLKDSIYVFTPQGQIIEMPIGSTPIDFAYRIHTEVGEHCIGARTQNKIIPLHAVLKNTDVIEIITSPNGHPRQSWLKIAKTLRAKSKIKHWLMHNDVETLTNNALIAKNKEAQKDFKGGNKRQPTPKTELEPDPKLKTASPSHDDKEENKLQYFNQTKLKIRVGDESNMMIKMAGCCHPTPSEEITGYVSRGRGIIIHRKDCTNIEHIPEIKERQINVEWDRENPHQTYHFRVLSRPTKELFSQIDNAIRKLNGVLLQGKVDEGDNNNLSGDFLIEFRQETDFTKIKKSLRNIPTILEITQIEK